MGRLTSSLGRLTYLDANIIVYAVEGYAQYEVVIKELLAAMDAGDLAVVTSELTIAEVLVKPKRTGDALLEEAYERFLQPTPVLSLAPVDRKVLVAAAEMRARTGMKLPDVIHLATAEQLGCDTFLTNDLSLHGAASVPVKRLADL